MQQCSKLRDPRHPRPRFRRIEVNMPRQPCHQQRWRAPRRSTGNISRQDARNREPASRHHTKVGDLLLQAPLQAKPARVLPQYDERSHSTSLDSQPIHGGADATGQSAIANDATAPTHRRRNPGESLHGGPTPPEPAIPPVAVGHEREPIRQGPAAMRVSNPPEAVTRLLDDRTTDLVRGSLGTFGHPWEATLCVWGAELIDAVAARNSGVQTRLCRRDGNPI